MFVLIFLLLKTTITKPFYYNTYYNYCCVNNTIDLKPVTNDLYL